MSNTKTVMSQAANTQGIPLDITDVFSTYLYEGDNTNPRTITNGIDLSGEGGMVWIKRRTATDYHVLSDTERGTDSRLSTNVTSAAGSGVVTAFNSNGFNVNDSGQVNFSGDYASWTFRKAPKFFDVVTYTGTQVAGLAISHNLGSVPGTIIVKRTDGTNAWTVYHRSLGNNKKLELNKTDSIVDIGNSIAWNTTTPTDTQFFLGADGGVNASGGTYVAYLFAHNDGDGGFGPDADQDIIKCGSYTGTATTGSPTIDLGFEPQFVLVKRTDSTGNWIIQDNMRSVNTTSTDMLFPNLSNAATTGSYATIVPTATGFYIGDNGTNYNASGGNYIYMAIRRGPLAPPKSATEVFNVSTRNASEPAYTSGFPVDFAFARAKNTANNWDTGSRLQQGNRMFTNLTNAEASNSNMMFDYQEGWSAGTGASTDYLSWMWKRAPNYFDVVAYTGTGSSSARAVSHNLGVDPEMMWVKRRDADIGTGWAVYHKGLDASAPQDYYLTINNAIDRTNSFYRWGDTAPTATDFYIVEDMDASGGTFIAYLFASLDGISKVGSYTGNGTSQTIDCGFTSGARFVLIKCTTVAYDWQVFDTERGIVAGNDSKLALNTTQAEQTNGDFIDPSSSGFAVTSSSSMNANGETFIFYAIA